MCYKVFLPVEPYAPLDLSNLCSHVHSDQPKKSCLVTVDQTIRGQPVRTKPSERPVATVLLCAVLQLLVQCVNC